MRLLCLVFVVPFRVKKMHVLSLKQKPLFEASALRLAELCADARRSVRGDEDASANEDELQQHEEHAPVAEALKLLPDTVVADAPQLIRDEISEYEVQRVLIDKSAPAPVPKGVETSTTAASNVADESKVEETSEVADLQKQIADLQAQLRAKEAESGQSSN